MQATLNAGGIAAGTAFLFKTDDIWTASSSGPMINLPANLIGASSNPILFGSYGPGAPPVLDGNGGLGTACFFANGGNVGTNPYLSYVAISGFECRNTSQYGVYFHQYNSAGGLPGILVENMNIHNTGPGAFAGASKSNSC